MFEVKNSGKNHYQIILPEDAKSIERKRRIEFDLNEALNNEEMFLVYQPKICLKTGDVLAVEALLRWDHPEFGMVSPGEFIPIAEESGIIKEIGYWVMYQSARQNKKWHQLGIHISTAVNVSAIQFGDKLLVRRIVEFLICLNWI